MAEMTTVERVKLLERERDVLVELKDASKDLTEIRELSLKILEKQLEIMKLNAEATSSTIAAKEKLIAVEKNLIKIREFELEQGEKTADALGALLGLNKSYETSMAGSIQAVLAGGQAHEGFRKQLKETFTLQNALYSLFLKVTQATGELTYATDKALVSFNKQTGATKLYGAEIKALEQDMFHHGVGINEATEGYGALVSNVTDLRRMSAGTRKELSTTTTVLAHMGVSADTTGANIQFMTKSLGIATGEASKYQRELFTLAREIGMPPEEMAAGFKAAAPKLAAFGKQAGKVFKTLAVNARAAGMEVEQMLSIVEQFDTFEGAAQSVGKLNALLGGPFLNSMEMVTTTDPTERMRLLSGALNDAGKSFDQMTYYEKKSIAAAAGLSDVNELALVMAGSFDSTAGGAHKSQAEIEKLAEESRQYNDFQEELNQTMRMFAIQLEPIVAGLKYMLQRFQDLNQYLGGNVIPIVGLLIAGYKGISTALKVWSFWTTTAATRQAALAAATGTSTAAQGAQIPVMIAAGTTAGAAATPMLYFAVAALAVGAAFFLVGAGVGLAAKGMALFMTSLALIPPADLAKYGLALWSISSGIGALTLAMIFGSGSLLAMSLNLMLLGWALDKLDFNRLQAVEGLFSSMAEAMNAPIENLAKMTSGVKEITDAIKSVDDINAVVGVSSLIDTSSKLSQSSKGGAPSSPVKAPVQDHTITLQFDPRSSNFEDFVIEIVNGQLNPNKFGYSTP